MSVQMRTMLDVADNSGARKLQVILPLGGGLGKQDGIKNIRGLKMDIARFKTIARERQLQSVAAATEEKQARRNEKVGQVVSTKMQKTIVVEIEMRKAHPKYKRVMKSNKKFYAHDELNSARVGDVVRIREARPLSKLKRWSLEEIVRRSSLSQLDEKSLAVDVT